MWCKNYVTLQWTAHSTCDRRSLRYLRNEKEFIPSLVTSFTFYRGVVAEINVISSLSLCRRLRWSRGSVLAFGTQVRGFRPGRSRRNFKGEKILSTPSFGGEVKPSVPCRRFAACKRFLELRGSRILDEICRNISRPRRVPPSAARGLLRRWTW